MSSAINFSTMDVCQQYIHIKATVFSRIKPNGLLNGAFSKDWIHGKDWRKIKTYESIILTDVLYECETWSLTLRGNTQTEGV
jgi:hypothetical protein